MHLSLHGCFGGNDYWATDGTGIIDYAASNDLILLFPCVKECYDTIGKTGSEWATRDGLQPKAFMKMIQRLFEPVD